MGGTAKSFIGGVDPVVESGAGSAAGLVEVGREVVGVDVVETRYRRANTEIVVTSSFIGGESLVDLMYESIRDKIDVLRGLQG